MLGTAPKHCPRINLVYLGFCLGLSDSHIPDDHTERNFVQHVSQVVDHVERVCRAGRIASRQVTVEIAERINRPTDGYNPAHGREGRLDRLWGLLCRKLAGFTSEDFIQDVEPTSHTDHKAEPYIQIADFTSITTHQHDHRTDGQTPENAR